MTASVAHTEPAAWDRRGELPRTGQCTLRQAPHREPPFEDESAGAVLSLVTTYDQPLPFEPPSDGVGQSRDLAAAQRGGLGHLPDPAALGRRLVIAIIELATGRRSALHLNRHLAPAVLSGLARDAGRITRLGTEGRPATLHSIHAASPADGVSELVAVVQVGERFRAIALRLEAKKGRWRCVRLQIG